MDDVHRQPKDRDREPLMARIRKAADDGRIGTADRDIRLGNVKSAQSMAELALIARDLDLLEQTLSPGSAPPPVAFTPPPVPPPPTASPGAPPPPPAVSVGGAGLAGLQTGWTAGTTETVLEATKTAAKRIAVTFIAIVALVLVAGGVVAYFAISGSNNDNESGELFDPTTEAPGSEAPGAENPGIENPGSEDPGAEDPASEPGEPSQAYALTGPGLRAYLAAYRAKFRTTRVINLTLYDGYAIARVPVPGKNRHAGWLYRPGQGWSDFGGVSANFPGTVPVDTTQLDVPALLRNIAKARRILNVENHSVTYVNIDYRPQFDEAVNVNVYVSNEFNESGYLATTLDGRVERAYPFGG